ncbi:SDR family NAD(P)-dependent oxidoreductase [Candidatus Uabimicrobium helgolandensis]
MHFKDKIVNGIYNKTIALSYGMPGYSLRKKYWTTQFPEDLSDKVYVVTGASSGIGKEIAFKLAARKARVIIVCRNLERGKQVQDYLLKTTQNRNIMLEMADLSDIGSIERLAYRFCNWYPQIDTIIHNAGVMLHHHEMTNDQIECTFATNVVGPFLLTMRILPLLQKSKDARIIQVTSGGMYTQKINVASLEKGAKDYDGVKTYAQTKRAQVILNSLWANSLKKREINVNCMHPGWVQTPGIKKSLPRFSKIFNKILRSPEAGADTAVWLATSDKMTQTGKLWFDRECKPEHVLSRTRENKEDAQELWSLLKKLTKYID